MIHAGTSYLTNNRKYAATISVISHEVLLYSGGSLPGSQPDGKAREYAYGPKMDAQPDQKFPLLVLDGHFLLHLSGAGALRMI